MRTRLAILIAASSAALGGCAYGYGGYGDSPFGGLSVGIGYGSGYGGYGSYSRYGCYGGYGGYGGYGSYGLGYGGYGGYDRFGFPIGGYGYGSRYGSYYGSRYGCMDPYWGWYGGYYYPGSGYYVYDRYRRPSVWSDSLRRYWSERRERAETVAKTRNEKLRTNWGDFDRRASRQGAIERVRSNIEDRRVQRQQSRSRTTTRERLRDRIRDEDRLNAPRPD